MLGLRERGREGGYAGGVGNNVGVRSATGRCDRGTTGANAVAGVGVGYTGKGGGIVCGVIARVGGGYDVLGGGIGACEEVTTTYPDEGGGV